METVILVMCILLLAMELIKLLILVMSLKVDEPEEYLEDEEEIEML